MTGNSSKAALIGSTEDTTGQNKLSEMFEFSNSETIVWKNVSKISLMEFNFLQASFHIVDDDPKASFMVKLLHMMKYSIK